MSSSRNAIHPDHFKTLSTEAIRKEFLITEIFIEDQITATYTHYDRMMIGGVQPTSRNLQLETLPELRSTYFLERREMGIINVGKAGTVVVDGVPYVLESKDALYLGKGVKTVVFEKSPGSLYYYNSTPAHLAYPTRKISLTEAETVKAGAPETANQRTIRKLLINSVLPTCQLQMGLTELMPGNVWNTMPAHTHDRRMEVYFYFEIPEQQRVCHFLGHPQETRHIWVQNHQAVLSPPWSIHAGAGTSNYCFIWGMGGENLDYSDMDAVKTSDLR
ncbi:MAG: 5-dehydro-4-deoxy-D-glucuronate isomerase [Cyclobacteriaceae bacterium]|nr:5-dehydro-4-deoxy-D-glucuronate isomerase [Cyclobacteriaceae bacterium]